MRTPFINHITECETCQKEPYTVCGEGLRMWRGDKVEMDSVNEHIQIRRQLLKIQRKITALVEAEQEAREDWPSEIGG